MFPATTDTPVPPSPGALTERMWARLPITGTSPQSVVLHLLRAVGEPSWAPAQASERLLEQVDDAVVLRRARALLRVVTPHRINPSHARAFATISMALNQLEDHLSAPSPSTRTPGDDGTHSLHLATRNGG